LAQFAKDWPATENSTREDLHLLYFYLSLTVPGHALLWLSLVKWKRKKRESARF
jgi:hypothetical protein